MCVFIRSNTLLLCIFVHGVGEQRRHHLVAPLLHPWRERGQSCWRVGWHGSSCWLLCLWSVLCFVFCPPTDDQTTVPFFPEVIFSSFQLMARRLYLFFPVVIFSGCNLNPLKNIAGQTTVRLFFRSLRSRQIWAASIGQMTVRFIFLVVIFSGCNLNPPEKTAGQTTRLYLFFRS